MCTLVDNIFLIFWGLCSKLNSDLTMLWSLQLSRKERELSNCLPLLIQSDLKLQKEQRVDFPYCIFYEIWGSYSNGTQICILKLRAEGSSKTVVSLWNLPMGFVGVIPNLQQAEPFLPTAHTCLFGPQLILASWSLGTCSHDVPCTIWPCS